jgi:hypothetical protein
MIEGIVEQIYVADIGHLTSKILRCGNGDHQFRRRDLGTERQIAATIAAVPALVPAENGRAVIPTVTGSPPGWLQVQNDQEALNGSLAS